MRVGVTCDTHGVETYATKLLAELDAIEDQYLSIIEASTVRNVDPNRGGGGIFFMGAQIWDWTPSDSEDEIRRTTCLATFRAWIIRFRLLFPEPLPRIAKELDKSEKHIVLWLERGRKDHSISPVMEKRVASARADIAGLRELATLLPEDSWAVRLVTDTNALIDDPDLTIYVGQLGGRYLVHILPIVMRELDDLKRSGRVPELREAAKRADRRLKGYRHNGDVQDAVRVAGDVQVKFEHADPKSDQLPSWLDLSVPDDRFIASVLLLQSAHPGSALVVVTGDMNMQTKLSAVGLPYIEQPDLVGRN